MKIDGKLAIYIERDSALRAHEYQIVSHDVTGMEVEGFSFYISDKGHIFQITPLKELTEEEVTG